MSSALLHRCRVDAAYGATTIMRILFVAPRFPFPPLRGDQTRTYHQLRILSRTNRLTFVTFAPPRRSAVNSIGRFCERVVLVPRPSWSIPFSVLAAIPSGVPFQTALFRTPTMRRMLDGLLASGDYDLLHAQLARVTANVHARPIPGVLDMIDALSLNMKHRARRSSRVSRVFFANEARRLAAYERRLCAEWDHVTVVSELDRRAIGSAANLSVNANGVDVAIFRFRLDRRDTDQILFSGNLGYFANVDAVVWFIREVLPRIRRVLPNARVHLVGARPHARLKRLAKRVPGIVLVGPVDDMRPHLDHAAVAVAPLLAGSGSPLKVLEAMAAGAPVVATPHAVASLEVESGTHLLVAEIPEAFADAVVELMRDRSRAEQLSRAARHLVEERYSWEHCVAELARTHASVVDGEGARS